MVDQDVHELDELTVDEATLAEEKDDKEALVVTSRRIFTDKLDSPIESLFNKYKDGELILDPIFQRRPVWDRIRSSRLIESVLLEIPLPVFYFAESDNDTQEVIDGQQRLRAFFSFIDDEYSLNGLKALPNLNTKKYKDLEKSVKSKFKSYPIRAVIFKKESDENLRFEIFERLNSGAVPLNYQELRNCIYRGSYNEMLIALSSDPDYMNLMGLKAPEARMHDVEYVLRFAAFFHATYLKYKPSMATFLNNDMKKYQKISKEDGEELRKAFKNSVTLIRSMLGVNAFRRYYRGDTKTHNGYWEPKKFNASLYDVLMWGFSDKDKNQVMANLDLIREAWVSLMTDDDQFIESIELSTSSIKSVTYRFDTWRQILEGILDNSSKQQRLFTRAQKEQLYKENPDCEICHQRISEVDDAAVDHIEQYWVGGRTELDNARLAHRYCNWARSKTDRVE
jgi:hypothetical protein